MKYLTRDQIIALHEELIDEFGGLHGIRDEGMLDSALNAPFQTYGDEDLFPSIIDKAARLCYGLVRNHPFLDGNKRIGAMAMLVFLDQNDRPLKCGEDELTQIVLHTADGSVDNSQLAMWVLRHLD